MDFAKYMPQIMAISQKLGKINVEGASDGNIIFVFLLLTGIPDRICSGALVQVKIARQAGTSNNFILLYCQF